MELHENIRLNGTTIDCEIDTGTSYTVIKKEILKKIGLKPVKKIKAQFADGIEKEVNTYIENIEVAGCKLPPTILVEGEENLLGHDVLQMMGANIDENKGKVQYRVCPSSIPKMPKVTFLYSIHYL